MQNIRILSKNIIEQALSWNVWRALKQYLEIIDKREARILAALAEPVSLNDQCVMGLIYGKKFLVNEWVRAWDALKIGRAHV